MNDFSEKCQTAPLLFLKEFSSNLDMVHVIVRSEPKTYNHGTVVPSLKKCLSLNIGVEVLCWAQNAKNQIKTTLEKMQPAISINQLCNISSSNSPASAEVGYNVENELPKPSSPDFLSKDLEINSRRRKYIDR